MPPEIETLHVRILRAKWDVARLAAKATNVGTRATLARAHQDLQSIAAEVHRVIDRLMEQTIETELLRAETHIALLDRQLNS